MNAADKTVFWLCMAIGVVFLAQTSYQTGYDEGRSFCRPPVKLNIESMSASARRAWVKYLAARAS